MALLSPQKGKQELAAKMKVDVMIYGGSAGCLDRDTEFLSKDGWKFLWEFEEGDEVLTFNDLDSTFQFEKPEDYIRLPCKDLFRLKGDNLDMVVSEEHCLLYWDEDDDLCETFLLDSAEDIVNNPTKYGFRNEHGEYLYCKELSYYKPLDGYKYCFNVSTGYFLARRNGRTFITGNSGKSRLLLLKAGYYAHTDKNFEGVMFRRTTKPLTAAGGLFSEAKKLFKPLGVTIREQALEILFHGEGGTAKNRKGGNLKFTHLEHEKDAEGNHQGLQYSFIGFDELTHFTLSQFLYLIGRMRSEADSDSFCLATTNPDGDSWVYDWVSFYLKDGLFDEDKLGKIRYFLVVNDSPVFADTAEELAELYPDLCYQWNDVDQRNEYIPPLTFCFVGGTIFDNPALIRQNPKYLAALKAQTEINRRRLLDGDWHAKPEGSSYFQASWLHKLERKPLGCSEVRAWDVASEEPSDKNRHPDFSASCKMLKTKDGDYVIVGDYEPQSLDENTKVMGRYRLRPGQRDNAMIRQAHHDGVDCTVCLPLDPAAAGKVAFRELSKKFIEAGFKVKQDPMPNNKSKLKKFEAFSSACQNGLVGIVESTFNPETLKAFYKELEAFDGERSTSSRKDDWADASCSAFNTLAVTKVRRPMHAGAATPTTLAQYKRS
ncbi:terminase large subunit [Vibrio phage PWH3a-P1]|uniref:terminase large subunit n=1 Tax=Vibrio phage PWH3a-P1 TaxID=754058 RepID=UPI0002C0AD0A|nr:terminase large subunit [Vibrio phage PWH3a-P1]AGH32018.1 terminase [Vibrio phage PWH3a-P1]